MQARTLGALMSAALVAACLVDRPTEKYACSTTADCAGFSDNRVCKSNFCVIPSCPADCPMCDEDQKLCPVDCTSAAGCGSVTCPTGWTCTINCTGGNACNNITCEAGSHCAITCTGTDACETVDCSAACKCDLTCATGACNTPRCPVVGNGANQVECTTDGTNTASCDSAHAAGCTKC